MDQERVRRIDPRAIPLLFFLRGVDINQKTDEGETMLHVAVRMRDKEVATVLLNAGGDINMKDDIGNTPLSSAIDTGSPDMVELLLKHNPNFDMDIVRDKFFISLLSSSTDDEKIVKSMINHGFTIKETDSTNATMVWTSILLGLEEVAISLVNFKKNFLPTVDMWYRSFLLHMQPLNESQTEMLRIIRKIKDLFMEGEEVDITGNHNLNLFKILLSECDIELINVNVMSVGGNFSDNEESDIVAITADVLLSCYDSENPVCDEKGRTGLHYAAKVGNVAVIQALLDLHLDINAKDIDGKTALDYISDRINEFSNGDNNDEAFNNEKHRDLEFNCWFTLLDLKIGAVLILKHISKLITANTYITMGNLKTVRSLLIMMNKDTVITQYYLSIYGFIEKCESEIKLMKSKKLVELSYYDFLTKNSNQIALYTKRKDVIEALQLKNDVLQEFEIYGPMLQHRFHISNIRRGLIEKAESLLFDILKWLQVSLVIVREILSNLSNDELSFIVLNA